ncbi:hypothetical protein [Sphingomonas astaxanthinifaciens]|uniref:Uncharacterized protein n=1 Tax=Sphingomonas astaxanthinifaciens DSM 22298 TaxID=1123267 RepID=A0ABQ5Z4Z1_9SPHN|nr:hypothetical protein [Sphingomonas astaxanthinifaciens]GLR46601.1 hypothetical protein GCM10007925_03120 [Sphingomonas astaxanthinifaciens DSM 22298]
MNEDTNRLKLLEQARDHARQLLGLLDEAGAPPHVSAQFDHGLSKLDELLSSAERRCA